jgi:hypothetical protein
MTEDQNTFQLTRNSFADKSIGKIGLEAGLITSGVLIVYFMIMKLFNFMTHEIAWGINFLILLAGIILAYSQFRSKSKLNIDYITGLSLGLITTVACVIPYVLFVFLFISQAEPAEIQGLSKNLFFMGEPVTALRIAGSTMIEGCCSGLIITFAMMQYFRSGSRVPDHSIRMQD